MKFVKAGWKARVALVGRLSFSTLAFVVLGVGFSQSSHAMEDEFDEEPPMAPAPGSPGPASVNSANTRLYANGRDDQPLEVQATLPQPTRSPDGTPPANSKNSEQDEDSTHD